MVWSKLATLAALCAVAGVGCADRSTSGEPAGTASGTLSLYVKDAPPRTLSAARVTFSEFRVHNRTTGQMIDLLAGREATIDLVKAHDDPYGAGYVGNFSVSPGEYDGVGALTVKTVSFTTDTNFTCTDPRFPMSAGPITGPATVLTMSPNGAASLVVDLPLAGGTCTVPGGVDGRLEFDMTRATCRAR